MAIFALWGFAVTLFVFAYAANLLPTRMTQSIRTGVGMAKAKWRAKPRVATPRQSAGSTPQQIPPVDPDAEESSESADAPESAPAAAGRGHRRPPRDATSLPPHD